MKLLFTSLLLILFSFSCTENEIEQSNKKDNAFIDYIPTKVERTQKKFEQIFKYVTKIVLKVDDNHLISEVKKIKVNGDNIIVCDARGKQLLVFKREGIYMNSIGKVGSGPGEFNRLTNFDITQNDEVILLDAANLRVSYFEIYGKYKKSFKVYPNFRIASSIKGGFYLYNPAGGGIASGSVVQEYNEEGKMIKSFCPPFFTFPAMGGNIECDNYDNIFIIHPTVYKIIKYFTEKDTFEVFGNISEFYQPIVIEKNKLPSIDNLNNSTPLKKVLVNEYYIIVEIDKGKPKTKWLDIYDNGGKIIYSGIRMYPYLSIGDIDNGNRIYFIKYPKPKKNSSLFELEDYEIIIYKLGEI